jgi:hypothetical protein
MKTLEITKQLITPSIAKNYLEQNLNNRRFSQPILLRYTADMINNKWKEDTGECIKISKTGRILDGQHRLKAVILSNCSIFFYIANNIDDSVFDVLDTGKSRNASDCFYVAGIKASHTIPSIISYFNLLEDGKKNGVQINKKATNSELLEQYYKDELFWDNIAKMSMSWYLSFATILKPSMIGGFYSHFYKLNPSKAEIFMNQLCTGSGINNAIINLLRNKLMQDKMSPRKMPMNLKMALIIKTWNHYINGNNVKILKFDMIRDDFPVAIKESFENSTQIFN